MNTIRTPKQGKTASSRRIAAAVDDQEWQKFRQFVLKGQKTQFKLMDLKAWQEVNHIGVKSDHNATLCRTCIQVDNYIKALCRGGQLKPKESLETALEADFKLEVLK